MSGKSGSGIPGLRISRKRVSAAIPAETATYELLKDQALTAHVATTYMHIRSVNDLFLHQSIRI